MEQDEELDIKRYLLLMLKQRYLFAITAAILITAAVIVSHLITPIYEAKSLVSVEKGFVNDALSNIGGTQSIDDRATALSTIMKSRTMVLQVLGELGIDMKGMTEAQVEGLIKNTQEKTKISVEYGRSGRNVDFFTVSYQSRYPEIARDYVNTVVGKYIELNIGSKREAFYGANRFLMEQINQHKEKVRRLDAEIAALKKDQNLIVYSKFLELQKRRDDLLVQYTEDHPEVIKVQSEIETLEAKHAISQKKLDYAANVLSRMTVLERERDASKKIFDDLTAAYGKSEVSAQADLQEKAGAFKIVDPAVLPKIPIRPNRIKIILLGIMGGIAGAGGLVILLDFFNDSIKDVDTIKRMGIPVLAIIPHFQDPHELIKTRRKDLYLFTLSGLYVVLLGAVIVMEKLRLLG